MISYIKKKIKKYIKNGKKYIFILPNKYYKNLSKEIYIRSAKKKIGSIPNIFFYKKEFIEKISNKKITNSWIYFFYFYSKITLKRKKIDIVYFNKLLNDLNYIDLNLINLKKTISYVTKYYNISKWIPNKKNYNNSKKFKEYFLFYKEIFKKKYVYYGLAFKIALKRLNKFINLNNKFKFIFIGNNFITNAEKKIKKKFTPFSTFIYYRNNKKKSNKTTIINTENNVNKYITLTKNIIANYKSKTKTTIIFTNNQIDSQLFNYIKPSLLEKINYNLYYKYDQLILHNFIKIIFILLEKNLKDVNYNILWNLIDYKYTNFFLKKNKIKKIKKYLRENKLGSNYIPFDKKYFKGSYFYILFNNKINNEQKIHYLNKAIKLLYKKKYNFNLIEQSYIKKILILVKFLLKIKKNINIKNLEKVLFYYIDKYKKTLSNYYYNSYLEIINYEFLIKENIVNYKDDGFIILNKYYDHNKINSTNLINVFTNQLTETKKKSIIKNQKIINIFGRFFILYSNKEKYLKNNLFYLFNILAKRKCKTIKYRSNNIINFVYRKNNIGFNIKKRFLFYIRNRGFNFTSLKYLIINPNNFLYKYIYNIKEYEETEAKIFGKIVHKILHSLYKKYINHLLNIEIINKIKKSINTKKIRKIYNKYYLGIKNRFFLKYNYDITKKIVLNFIERDEKLIKDGNTIKIIYLEKYYRIKILNHILFTGKIDRIDIYNNIYRVVDYKTYLFKSNKILFIYKSNKDIKNLFSNSLNENILQLLIYSITVLKEKRKCNFLYNTIYYPTIIKNIKINYSIKINFDFIEKIEKILYQTIISLYKTKFLKRTLYF